MYYLRPNVNNDKLNIKIANIYYASNTINIRIINMCLSSKKIISVTRKL